MIARWDSLFRDIELALSVAPGLVAVTFGSSERCGSGRTLAVWSSEDVMYEFVGSKAHLAAMAAADEVLQPGFEVTHWAGTDPAKMDVNEAVRRLRESAK